MASPNSGLLASLLAVLLLLVSQDPNMVRVPETGGSVPVTDGIFSPGEWEEAVRISGLGRTDGVPGAEVYLRKQGDDLFIGVPCSGEDLPVVDLFLNPHGETVYQLHVSSYLAERAVPETPAEEAWLETELSLDWTSSRVRWDPAVRDSLAALGIYGQAMLREAILPMDGFEIRIGRSQFESPLWRLAVQVGVFGQSAASATDPAEVPPADPSRWLTLDLGAPPTRAPAP